MKIYAPVKHTNGVYCNVRFVNGVGETDNPRLIKWFKDHGYRLQEATPIVELVEEVVEVEEIKEDVELSFEDMTPNQLRDWMKANGLGREVKNIRNKEKLLEIINEKG